MLTLIAVASLFGSEHPTRRTQAADQTIQHHGEPGVLTTIPLAAEPPTASSPAPGIIDDQADQPVEPRASACNELVSSPSTLHGAESNEIWEISTRHLPDRFRCINTFDPGFDVHRFSCGRWLPESLNSALANDGKLTIVYVHGNFMERNNTLQRVRIVDGYLKPRAHRPYRLILFSWPSQREPHPLRDVLENAQSAECQSLYLAWLLERLREHSQVSLLGFSFGSRTVTGALHLVSGGSISGLHYQNLAGPGAIRSVYHVGLVAPAVDRYWLAPSGKLNHALDRVEEFNSIYNSQDPVLRRFQWLDRTRRPVAGGFAGFAGLTNRPGNGSMTTAFDSYSPAHLVADAPEDRTIQIQQFNAAGSVGSTHSERSYYRECPSFAILLNSLLWNEPVGFCLSP